MRLNSMISSKKYQSREKEVNDIEIAILFCFGKSTGVNKQLVSWQSTVMEHEV